MTDDEITRLWIHADYAAFDAARRETWVSAYLDWLDRRQVWKSDPYTHWDCSGVLVDDDETTTLDRLLMYDTLREWAEGERSGTREPTFMSGMGMSYPTFFSELRREDSSEHISFLLSLLPDDTPDDVSNLACDWDCASDLTDWHAIRPADLDRAIWLDALVDHFRWSGGKEAVARGLEVAYPEVRWFALVNHLDDYARWLVVADWLEERDGAQLASAIREWVQDEVTT